MQARCVHCGRVQALDDNIFGNRERVEVPCPACRKTFPVVNPKLATFRSETTRKKLSTITSEVGVDGRLLSLPEYYEISLRVIEGTEKGTVYPVTKPRLTIGRSNADIVVNDALSSRVHCALEISPQAIVLRDLDSTNGTFVNDAPVQTATLSNGSSFRIGGHTFQLVITPKGP